MNESTCPPPHPTRSARRPAPPSSCSSSGGPRSRGRRTKASGRSVQRITGRALISILLELGRGASEQGSSLEEGSRGTRFAPCLFLPDLLFSDALFGICELPFLLVRDPTHPTTLSLQ